MLMVPVMLSFMDFLDPWYNKYMEEEQIKQPNKYIEYIKTHKYNVYFVVAIVFIIILIISMLVLIINPSTNKNISSSPQGGNSPPITPSSKIITPTIIITTPNPTEAAMIGSQTQPQITPNVAVPYTVSEITKYGDNWATMTITNPDVGNGIVILRKVNGDWKVIMGPGSYFSPDKLQSIGAPEQLINQFTNSPSPSELPSAISPTFVPGDIQ